MIASNFEY